jgi:hypothetical protein
MATQYPNDADGEALRRLEEEGNDMNAPMVVEFPVVVRNEADAERVAILLEERGLEAEIWQTDVEDCWDVVCSVEMIPTYDKIVKMQHDLTEWCKPHGGVCDSWGSFGNTDEKPDEE